MTILVVSKPIRNEFKAFSQSVFKRLRKKAAPLVVFLYKLKLTKLASLRSARAQNSSAHDYRTVASINQLDAAHKRKPQDNVRMLVILILFIFA